MAFVSWFALTRKSLLLSESGNLLCLRWLLWTLLFFLTLYHGDANPGSSLSSFLFLGLYALSNILLWWLAPAGAIPPHRGATAFLLDTVLVGGILYKTVGVDADLYLICFLLVYLSSLGHRLRDAIPFTFLGGLLYVALLMHQDKPLELLNPQMLLRFPLFFVIAIYTSYLSEETTRQRTLLRKLESTQAILKQELKATAGELDKKQAALIQAEKLSAMGHMAGALAHEIRNPLSVIIGYVCDILERMPPSHSDRAALAAVDRCAQRCNRLVENLLRFARLPKEKEPFNLSEALEESVMLARLGRKALDVKVTTDLRVESPYVGRRSEIEQVVVNLCTNAIDAMPKGGTLTLRTEQTRASGRDWVVISVQDTGVGIPEQLRKRIFEPFITTKSGTQGTGLGLSIVSDIVRAYGGCMEVQSTPGQGAIFKVYLPLEAVDSALPVAA